MPTRSAAAAAASSSSAAGISPPRPFNGFASTSSQASSSNARPSTRSTSSFSTAPSQMDSSFWSPASSASSAFQPSSYPHAAHGQHLPLGSNVKDEPDLLSGQFPALRLASASEAESTADGDDEERRLRAYAAATASSSSSRARSSTKGVSKRAKVSEEDEDEDGHDSADGVTRKLSLKTRNRLKQRAHRERRALHLSTLESQVAEMATLKADLVASQAALAHADAVAQGQRMTYEAVIRDLSMRDREREGLLLAFQSEIFRLRAIVAGSNGSVNGQAEASAQSNGASAPANGAGAGAGGADRSGLEGIAGAAHKPPKASGQGLNLAPQPFPFPALGQQQPFYFFAPPPPPQGHAQPPHFVGPPVWHGPPPSFGPPPMSVDANGGMRGPAFQPGPPQPLPTHLNLTPSGSPAPAPPTTADGLPYNLFPPHLRPAATGMSPKAPSPENPSTVDGETTPAAGANHASPALSQQGFATSDEQRQNGSSPAGQVVVNSPPIPSSSKLLATLPQLQTHFQPPRPLSTGPAGAEHDKEGSDGLVPMASSPSILTPTASAPHHGLYPQAGGPMPSPFSAFPYGYPPTAGGAAPNWSFTATTPTNGMGSALWGGLGVPGTQPWPWMGGGVSPVASSPAWAAWGNPPSGRPSSSGTGEGNAA